MQKKECIAMLLAGGQGSRLGVLTKKLAKPAVPFGARYRIIDFTLSNCYNSGIDTVGVLTQYRPFALNSYIGIGSAWDLDRKHGGVFILPPFMREQGGDWYTGTADAIYQNINFIDMYDPVYVLILSGDHIYTMDYSLMLKQHKQLKADATIGVIEVPWGETRRFGIMNTAGDGIITKFEEKPANAKSNLASMGVYIFDWPVLRKYLQDDAHNSASSHDFGRNIIPQMLADDQKLWAYSFRHYWKDVGTVESYWEANMDLLADAPKLNLFDPQWRIYSVSPTRPPHYVGADAKITRALIGDGALILGKVDHSVIFPEVYIGRGAVLEDSVIMPNCRIEDNVRLAKAVVGENAVIKQGAVIGGKDKNEEYGAITVIAENTIVAGKQ